MNGMDRDPRRPERSQTDRGLLGDKVGVSDPAAAPLETDSETSGQPTSARAEAESVARQRRIAREMPKPAMAPFSALQGKQSWGGRHSGIGLAAGAAVVLVLFGLLAGWVSVADMGDQTAEAPETRGTIERDAR